MGKNKKVAHKVIANCVTDVNSRAYGKPGNPDPETEPEPEPETKTETELEK